MQLFFFRDFTKIWKKVGLIYKLYIKNKCKKIDIRK